MHVQFLSQEGGDEEEAVGSVECEVERPRGPDNSSKAGWQRDFDLFSNWLYRETPGLRLSYQVRSCRLRFIWTIRVFRVLRRYCTADQILVYFANTFRPYRNQVFSYGYRWRQGLAVAQQIANSELLDRDHVDSQVFGEADPDRSTWDN